jgi:hypothetical protein
MKREKIFYVYNESGGNFGEFSGAPAYIRVCFLYGPNDYEPYL